LRVTLAGTNFADNGLSLCQQDTDNI